MVTGQKMNESEIGYRGLKSGIYNNIAVKGQRVNGCRGGKNFPHLRYTLVDFARNYLTKIPSNQINLTRNYSQLQSKLTLNPGYITGFADGEGLLYVNYNKR